MPGIPVTQEAEVGGSFEARRSKPTWAMEQILSLKNKVISKTELFSSTLL